MTLSNTASTTTAATKKPTFQMTGISTESPYLKMLVYGQPGAGKTLLTGSSIDIPSMKDVFLINAEGGDMTLRDTDIIEHTEDFDWSVANVQSMSDVQNIIKVVTAHARARAEKDWDKVKKINADMGIPEDVDKKFRTIIIDSLTEIEQYNFEKLLGQEANRASGTLNFDSKTAEFKEYKQNHAIINLFTRHFRDLPCHLLVICGEVYAENDDKMQKFGPKLTGKLVTSLPAYFDVVGRLEATENRAEKRLDRKLHVQPSNRWYAKNRRSCFKEPMMLNPTMRTIMENLQIPTELKE